VKINSDTPTYNLRAVVQETGLKADTLRAWERRYGLPVPKRSEGGHRLYSRRDIEILKWLVARIAEGLSISRAVELWRNLQAEGEDPVADLLLSPLGQSQPTVDSGSSLDELREAWLKACLSFNERTAKSVIAQAFAIFPVEMVAHQILRKARYETGEKWFSGEVTVQQEHFISQLTLNRLGALLVGTPAPTRSEKIITACPPGEEHTISLVLLTLGLRRRGFQVYYFGGDTPVNQIEALIETIKPNLVISSAQLLTSSVSLLTMAQTLFEHETPFAYGGRIFTLVPDIQNRIPGHYLGVRLEETFEQIEHIAVNKLMPENRTSTSGIYDEEHEHLLDHRKEIELKVAKNLARDGISEELSRTIVDHLNLSILSALKMGDLDFLAYDLGWLDRLLDNRLGASTPAKSILREFFIVASDILNSDGQVLLEWVQERINTDMQRSN
jgi:DNA-binding transcriptional MerR regulator